MHFKKQPCCHDMTVEVFLMADSHGDVMHVQRNAYTLPYCQASLSIKGLENQINFMRILKCQWPQKMSSE